MEIDVAFAYLEGTLTRWDVMSVTVLHTTKHRKRAAKAQALAALESGGLIVSKVWIDFIHDQRAVECPKCGSWQVHVVDVEYARDGEIVTLDEPVEIQEDGEWYLPDKFDDAQGYSLVDKAWAVCDCCGHRDRPNEFILDD